MRRPNPSLIALLTVTCIILLLATLIFSLAAPNSQAAAFLQGPSNTPYYTPVTLIPFDHQQSNAGFGAAVSTSNGVILVGAPNSFSNQGAAYIYNQPNFTTWDQMTELIAPDGDADVVESRSGRDRVLQPRRQQLHRQAGGLRAVPRGGSHHRVLLAVPE